MRGIGALEAGSDVRVAKNAPIVVGLVDRQVIIVGVAVLQVVAGLAVVVLRGTGAEGGAGEAQKILKVETDVAFGAGAASGDDLQAVVGDYRLRLAG